MALSQSRLAYGDCYRLMDKAIADPTGIRIRVETEAAGKHLRMRFHQARTIDRDDNRKTYEIDHMMYNRSIYDVLVFRSPYTDDDGAVWLQVDKPEATTFEVESLSGAEEETVTKADDEVAEADTSVDLPTEPLRREV